MLSFQQSRFLCSKHFPTLKGSFLKTKRNQIYSFCSTLYSINSSLLKQKKYVHWMFLCSQLYVTITRCLKFLLTQINSDRNSLTCICINILFSLSFLFLSFSPSQCTPFLSLHSHTTLLRHDDYGCDCPQQYCLSCRRPYRSRQQKKQSMFIFSSTPLLNNFQQIL